MRECRDPYYLLALTNAFKERYCNAESISKKKSQFIQEDDLDLANFVNEDEKPFLSWTLWQIIVQNLLPEYYIHCERKFNNELNKYGNLEGKDGFRGNVAQMRERDKIWTTLTNIAHLPADRIIHLSEENYCGGWGKIFPTAVSYLEKLSRKKVETSKDTINKLSRIVIESAKIILTTMNKMVDDKVQSETLQAVLTDSDPLLIDEQKLKKVMECVDFISWIFSNEEELKSEEKLFVAPGESGYHGIASQLGIGINEKLLVEGDHRKLISTIRHELLHKFTGLSDYTRGYIALLLQMVKDNSETKSCQQNTTTNSH